jgi:hypothetical protein
MEKELCGSSVSLLTEAHRLRRSQEKMSCVVWVQLIFTLANTSAVRNFAWLQPQLSPTQSQVGNITEKYLEEKNPSSCFISRCAWLGLM